MNYMLEVLILGAGGHAQVVTDIFLRAHEAGVNCKPIGLLDDDPVLVDRTIMGLPVLGNIAQLSNLDHDAAIVAIGDNHSRSRIFELVRAQGERLVNAIHPSAVLAPDVQLGEGVMICAGVIINTGTIIRDNVILNTGSTIDHHNYIGDHAHIAPGVHLGGDVRIGHGVLVGIGAVIIPGCSVGDWSIIGAGAVVTKDIPPYTMAVGVPARAIKQSKSQL